MVLKAAMPTAVMTMTMSAMTVMIMLMAADLA
jgi:hypothetical protein